MYEPLHHKYRPKTFADLVGQDAIAHTLTNAIASRKIAPAYMFTGPRGTGKTSSARILAKSLNCQNSDTPTATPCGHCDACKAIASGSSLDVIEIDAASNTGVDNIREIIERAQFAPMQCRYKVYVIDECHSLSTAAFNALLKTLEEPPARVVFVLATTDPQRVLTTIISRCQRFDFRRISLEPMVAHLRAIADIETINITDEAIRVVAQVANGGLRDAESLLDQLSLLSGLVDVERVWDLVGAIPERQLIALIEALRQDDPEKVVTICRELLDRGREPLAVLQGLAGFYLNLAIAKTAPNRQDLVAVTGETWERLQSEAQHWEMADILRSQQHLKDSEVQLRHTTQARLWLEVILMGLLPNAIAPTVEIATPPRLEQAAKVEPPQVPKPEPTPPPQPKALSPKPVQSTTATSYQNRVDQTWQQVLGLLSPLSQALVRQHCRLADFNLDDEIAFVEVRSKNLMPVAERFKSEIESALEQAWQERIEVRFRLPKEKSAFAELPDLSSRAKPEPAPVSCEPEPAIPSPVAVAEPPPKVRQLTKAQPDFGDKEDVAIAPDFKDSVQWIVKEFDGVVVEWEKN